MGGCPPDTSVPLLLAFPAAHAWTVETTTSGDPVRWIEMPIAWSFDADGAPPIDEVHGAIEAAFDAWAWVDGTDVTFVQEPAEIDEATTAHDLVNLVYFDDAWPAGEPALALASTWSHTDGTLLAFDIRLDASADWSTSGDADAYDLQAALTHEIGHTLGLEHSDVVDATMYGVHARGEEWRRELHADDEDALRHLYARPTLDDAGSALLDGGSNLPGPHARSASCGLSRPVTWTFLHVAFVLLSVRFRRRVTAR